MALLDKAKAVCRVTSTAYDDEITDLIEAGKADLGITDIDESILLDTDNHPLLIRALMTYCKMNFGEVDADKYDRLKESYDEQKAQMAMSGEYTDWGDHRA